jgi:alkylation response protein AidB-like acyl-CoA dehydrogenase
MEMVRWITWRLAWKMDQGGADWRREAAMVKLQGSEMIARVSDRAIQLLGGMRVRTATGREIRLPSPRLRSNAALMPSSPSVATEL